MLSLVSILCFSDSKLIVVYFQLIPVVESTLKKKINMILNNTRDYSNSQDEDKDLHDPKPNIIVSSSEIIYT